MLLEWLRAFLLTQIVEMGVYARATKAARPWRERLAIAFGASAITHPVVFFVIVEGMSAVLPPDLGWRARWWIGVAVAESYAVSAEAIWLALFGVRPAAALGFALFANGASFTIGLFLYAYLWGA